MADEVRSGLSAMLQAHEPSCSTMWPCAACSAAAAGFLKRPARVPSLGTLVRLTLDRPCGLKSGDEGTIIGVAPPVTEGQRVWVVLFTLEVDDPYLNSWHGRLVTVRLPESAFVVVVSLEEGT